MKGPVDTAKLGKILALLESPNDGEALAATRAAVRMLADAGMSPRDLAKPAPSMVATAKATTGSAPSFSDIFGGYADYMEKKEPGYKDRAAKEKADRDAAEAAFRAETITKYGSEDAAAAPTERERLLDEATAHLRRVIIYKFANGPAEIDTLDGWAPFMFGDDSFPASVREAVSTAFPLPDSIRAAREELAGWDLRDRELAAIYECHTADTMLGRAAAARRLVIKEIVEKGTIESLEDLHERLKLAADAEFSDVAADLADDILAAFESLVLDRSGDGAPVQSGQTTSAEGGVQCGRTVSPTSARRAAILSLLSDPATAGLADREIARRVGCSPQTVGNLRRGAHA